MFHTSFLVAVISLYFVGTAKVEAGGDQTAEACINQLSCGATQCLGADTSVCCAADKTLNTNGVKTCCIHGEKTTVDGQEACPAPSDPCSEKIKQDCSSNNRMNCTVGAPQCGGCKEAYYEDGGTCVLRKRCEEDQSGGTCSIIGVVFDNNGVCNTDECASIDYGDQYSNCCKEDPCNNAAKTACADAHRVDCSTGSPACGGCKTNFYDDSGTCTELQKCKDDTTGGTCSEAGSMRDDDAKCATNACGGDDFGDNTKRCCKHNPCDDTAKQDCASLNKEECSPGSTMCGSCKPGYRKDVWGICNEVQQCKDDESNGTCDAPDIKDNDAYCSSNKCDANDFGYSSNNCCMYDLCDSPAKQACADANRYECTSGSPMCGGCKANFYNMSGNCTAQQQCKNSTSGGSCTSPAIKDNNAYCAKDVCSANDFGNEDSNCCREDPCNNFVKQTCLDAHRTHCSSGFDTCGPCKANFFDDDGNCTALQQCKDDTSDSICLGSTIKNDNAYCSKNMCSPSDFGDSSTNCCMDVYSSPSPSGGAPAPGGLLGGSLDRSVQNSPAPNALSGACTQQHSFVAGALTIIMHMFVCWTSIF